jgi:hypothetical protein
MKIYTALEIRELCSDASFNFEEQRIRYVKVDDVIEQLKTPKRTKKTIIEKLSEVRE